MKIARRAGRAGETQLFSGNTLDKRGKDFILKKLSNWGIVQRQDSRLWICLSRFESWSPSHSFTKIF
jgi:hypothetical protein